jgi:hypothetical protein
MNLCAFPPGQGAIDKYRAEALSSTATTECEPVETVPNLSLSLYDLSGVFILYSIAAAFLMVLELGQVLVEWVVYRKKQPSQHEYSPALQDAGQGK